MLSAHHQMDVLNGRRSKCCYGFIGFAALLAAMATVVQAMPVETIRDRVGCMYDLTLCQNDEACFDDTLFGTCINDERNAPTYAGLSETQLEQTRALMQQLVSEGRTWHDYVTQCTVGRLLAGFLAGQRMDLDECGAQDAVLEQQAENEALALAARSAQMQQALDAMLYSKNNGQMDADNDDAETQQENDDDANSNSGGPLSRKFFKVLSNAITLTANPAHLELADAAALRGGDHMVPVTTKRTVSRKTPDGLALVPAATTTLERADRETRRGQRELGWPPYDNGENESGTAAQLLLSHKQPTTAQRRPTAAAQLARFDIRDATAEDEEEQLPGASDDNEEEQTESFDNDAANAQLLVRLMNANENGQNDFAQPAMDPYDPRKMKRSIDDNLVFSPPKVQLLEELIQADQEDNNNDAENEIPHGAVSDEEVAAMAEYLAALKQPQNDDDAVPRQFTEQDLADLPAIRSIVFPTNNNNNNNAEDDENGIVVGRASPIGLFSGNIMDNNYISDDTHVAGMNKKDREHIAFGANSVNLGPNLLDAEVVRQKWADAAAAALLSLPEMSQIVTSDELLERTGANSADAPVDSSEKDKMLNDPNYELVDASYVYMDVDRTPTYDEIRSILSAISYIMEIPPTTFSDIRFSGTHVTFRVSPFLDRTNATLVARVLAQDYVRKTAKEMLNLDINTAGIEARPLGAYSSLRSGELLVEQLQPIDIPVTSESRRVSRVTLGMYVVGACLAVGLVGMLALLAVGRRKRTNRRLADLLARDHEAGSDVYQDLCRQHMAAKQGVEKSGGSSAAAVGPSGTFATTTTTAITKKRNGSDRSSTSSWSEEPVKMDMDINTGHKILNYMEDLLKDRTRIDKEWENLCKYEAEPNKTDVGSQPKNAEKNRYADIVPYDHTRVPLTASNNVNKSDYINASFITDSDPKLPMYIATQGPMTNTVADFWQMVWEQGSPTIVCLTRMRENGGDSESGEELCHQYWRQETTAVAVYHTFEVRLVSEHSWCDDYVVRSFYLKNTKTNETRTVTQFHFKSWPYLSTPASARPLLEFRRKINKSFHNRSHPIIVHDSDGCDRAGSFILLDMVLSRMAKGVVKQVDVAATLEHIRDQRMQMVRTKEQFEFVITAIAEEVQAILKSLQ